MAKAEFHLFSHLPIEIRKLIWSLSLPAKQRIQVISYISLSTASATATYSAPSILFVCKESRGEALRSLYRLVLPSTHTLCPSSNPYSLDSSALSPQPTHETPQVCYSNRFLDTVYLSCNPLLRSLLPSWLANDVVSAKYLNDFTRIQSLAIDRRWVSLLPESNRSNPFDNHNEIIQYISLETIIRLMGKVEILHIISHDGRWQLFSSFSLGTERHSLERDYSSNIPTYEWVTAEEIAKRTEPVGRPRIWAEWGPMTITAREIAEVLNTGSENAIRVRKEMERRLEMERAKYPGGWMVPIVTLDFVTPTKIRIVRDKTVCAGNKVDISTLKQIQLKDEARNDVVGVRGLWSRIRQLLTL